MAAHLKSVPSIWSGNARDDPLKGELKKILGSVTRLPLKFWKRNMFFFGAGDRQLHELSQGRFPAKVDKKKSHPIFALEPLPQGIGFKVCPCSSKKPYDLPSFRFIIKGCKLLHTGYITDRNSYLVENITFNIPRSLAIKMRFRGETPETCIRRATRRRS